MGEGTERSIQKKQHILEKAREVFAERGFKSVTMKDIVDACQISRGGLYLYFESTEQIFTEILHMETYHTEEEKTEEEDDGVDAALREMEDSSVMDVLTLFLKEQKKDILKNQTNLDMAIYEYYMVADVSDKENYIKQQFDYAVDVLCKLITAGVHRGELYCEDPKGAAENMMYVLQGMRIMAKSTGISEYSMDRQLVYLVQNLVIDQE